MFIAVSMQWGGGKAKMCLTFTGSMCLSSDLQKICFDFQVSCGAENTAYYVV